MDDQRTSSSTNATKTDAGKPTSEGASTSSVASAVRKAWKASSATLLSCVRDPLRGLRVMAQVLLVLGLLQLLLLVLYPAAIGLTLTVALLLILAPIRRILLSGFLANLRAAKAPPATTESKPNA